MSTCESTALGSDEAWLILSNLPNLGPVGVRKLHEHFDHDITRVLSVSERALQEVPGIGPNTASTIANWRNNIDLAILRQELKAKGARFISNQSPDYPSLLKEIYDPPLGLYIKGNALPSQRNIAIIGSRRCTLYGRKIAHQLAYDLAQAGFTIVSGMARGIDTSAHEGALEAWGTTCAYLGTGVDRIYPPENADLYNRIQANGAVISEFPLGRWADKRTFPMRNRLIAGTCEATIVVETANHGGSMITARLANEQGRQVFAVPGRVDQESSRGCHALIRDGATLLRSADDLLNEIASIQQEQFLFPEEPSLRPKTTRPSVNLSPSQAQLLKIVHEAGPIGLDAIAATSGMPVHSVTAELAMLEIQRLVSKRPGGEFESV